MEVDGEQVEEADAQPSTVRDSTALVDVNQPKIVTFEFSPEQHRRCLHEGAAGLASPKSPDPVSEGLQLRGARVP